MKKEKEKEISCSLCLNAPVLAILKGDSACERSPSNTKYDK